MKKVIDFINSLKINEQKIVVAVSAGPDSMFLLTMLIKMQMDIVVAHVNHNIRDESSEEQQFLENFCLERSIPFENMIIENYTAENFEQQARKIRYDFFEQVLQKYKSSYLFMAHHGDDLMETVLMRLTRGSSFKGYAAFPIISNRQNYQIIRPLMYITKDDILKYNKENNIEYRVDQTNFEDIHTRNRFRKYVLPFLKQEDKKVHLKFLKFSNNIFEYEDYINKEVDKIFAKVYQNSYINISLINKQHIVIKKEILERILNIVYNNNNLDSINDSHINILLNLLVDSKPNQKLDFPKNIQIVKSYDKIYFKSFQENINYAYEFKNNISIMNKYKFIILNESDEKSNYVIRLNSKELVLPFIIRNKKDGDTMVVKGINKNKKLKDIFINEKIPVVDRINYPVLCDSNNNIVWLPGIKKSIFDKEINDEYDIIIKYIEEGE